MTSATIRQYFLDFFRAKGHTIVPSAPIVVKDDPTLMFTNAGMNQFKDYFLGNKRPPHARMADTQKCLRVSGKHNDLEEVGVDTYHHTMFEMLGNWSFGDYFKEEAIAWSWELLTETYKIDKRRLYVTVFEGDAKENLPKDEEAIACWRRSLVAAGFTQAEADDRIIMGNKKDNFWEMGDTGPCGPCTEIHIDSRGEAEMAKIPGKDLVNMDHPQVIEIWNNVFIQFDRKKDGSLEPLPAKHVDTGMGFERLVRVLQGKNSNYDTDVFSGTIEEIEKLSGKKYEAGDSKKDVAFRVIADHIRAIAFPIADGQLPSNTGAGYVIRRILRRAVRYYFTYLEVKQPLLHRLIPLLAAQFADVFPELDKQKDFVAKVIREEEDAFLRTVDKGLSMLEKTNSDISGADAFKLYDTFGFPVDLTRLIAAEKGLNVDEAGFEKEMKRQKDRSRAAGAVDMEDWIVLDESGSSKFVGYDTLETSSKVVKYRKVTSQGKENFQLVLDTTPFYAESGGQVGDRGILYFGGEEIEVTDTKKDNDLIIHFIEKIPASIEGTLRAKINTERRTATQMNHSATHLMHAALRTVLGTHVVQKGSLVNPEHLRFDFSHFAKVTDEELAAIEALVNEKIRQNIPVVIKEMKKEEALAGGAMALFGEKYGDMVRVVIMDPAYSVELCGGTHAASTGELGLFRIRQESAVGAGLRRIEAVSGKAAEEYINQEMESLRAAREILKNPKDLIKAIGQLLSENGELKKNVEKFEAQHLISLKNELVKNATNVNGVTFVGSVLDVSNADALKKICFSLKNELKSYVVILAAGIDGKAHVALMLDESLAAAKNWEAPKIIKEHIAGLIKGGGGGQKTLATAGGQDSSRLDEVISTVKSLL